MGSMGLCYAQGRVPEIGEDCLKEREDGEEVSGRVTWQ
jgi:hypothetical protein